MPQVTVKHRFIHQAPRKLRLVGDMVRGLPADKAVAELAAIPQAASLAVRKAIVAGIAAARQQGLNMQQLFVGQIMVDEGPKLRRINMLGRGRSARIEKKMSHLIVTIIDEPTKIASSKVYKAELGIAKPAKAARQTKAEKTEVNDKKETAEEVVETPAEQTTEAAEVTTEGSK